MATLKDIARQTGLSVTQVSRALNDHGDVNEATRERVKQAARSLNYQPNISARKLVSGRSGIVGLVVPDNPNLRSNTLFLEIVAGLSSAFSGRGMQFVLHVAQGPDDILTVYRKLISGGALDGFVLIEPADRDPRIDFLSGLGVPFVVHGRAGPRPDYPYFDIDNRRLAEESAGYLIARGHRHIALVNGVAGRSYTSARAEGYRAALRAAGIASRAEFLRHAEMDEAHGLLSTVQMFSGPAPHPTAILCSSTRIARGVYQALEALGLSIPQDVSVIAHDDHLPALRASAFYPALTVTKSPLRDSLAPLAACLAGAIAGKPLQELQIVAEYEFIERNSVAPPPAAIRPSRA